MTANSFKCKGSGIFIFKIYLQKQTIMCFIKSVPEKKKREVRGSVVALLSLMF